MTLTPIVGHSTDNRYPVLFVGAGPGDPELITVKGKSALEKAHVVIYAGSLVPEALLQWTSKKALRYNSASMNLDEIVQIMETGYFQGQRIVRLHTGDPSLYGAILEQMSALDDRDIPFKIIPGVTAAFAAAAALKLEYTLPELTQTLILTRMSGRTTVPESEALESLCRHQASLVIYLSVGMVDQVQRILSRTYGKDTGCAVVYRASHPDEKVIVTTIDQLAASVQKADISRQAVIIVSKALASRRDKHAPHSKLYDKHFAHGFRHGMSEDP